MTLYHFSPAMFEAFDASLLGTSTEARGCDTDDTMAVSRFGFCFFQAKDSATLISEYGDSFGTHLATCELDASENFDSTWEDFADWINRDGIEAVRECLEADGVEYLRLHNGSFNEIIPMHPENVEIIGWN